MTAARKIQDSFFVPGGDRISLLNPGDASFVTLQLQHCNEYLARLTANC